MNLVKRFRDSLKNNRRSFDYVCRKKRDKLRLG